MKKNLIMNSDSYKMSHWKQYPENTEALFSYFESRGSDRDYEETVFFGLQYLVKEYLSKPITMEDVEKAKVTAERHIGVFNYEGWKGIVEKHNGYLPIKIKAVPEGTVVPLHNILMSVESTDPEFFWVVSYVETLLVRLWYPITVATQSYYLRNLILKYLEETSDNPLEEIDFKLHDFGSRGVSSQESSMIGGASHLINFKGTDTLDALDFVEEYYKSTNVGFSIPAGEHSTFSSWGRENEVEAYRNMLDQYAKEGSILAVVSDTWDIYNACDKIWGEELKQKVIDSGATVVIRPDSGDPKTVVMKCLRILRDKFGVTTNRKGYQVLNNVRLIQGDGVNPESIKEILDAMTEAKFSTTNIAFGMGGALLQKVNRDTLKMAYKCSAIKIDGEWRDVYKQPVTDTGKTSKKGRLDLIDTPDGFKTISNQEASNYVSAMTTYFEDGKVLCDYSLEEIRNRLSAYFDTRPSFTNTISANRVSTS